MAASPPDHHYSTQQQHNSSDYSEANQTGYSSNIIQKNANGLNGS